MESCQKPSIALTLNIAKPVKYTMESTALKYEYKNPRLSVKNRFEMAFTDS